MLGANDVQAFYENGDYLPFNTSAWWEGLFRPGRLSDGGGHDCGRPRHVGSGCRRWGRGFDVVRGLPKPGGTGGLRRSRLPHIWAWRIFSAAKVLSSKSGGFTQYLMIDGSLEQIRYPDGVHLAPAGYDLLARGPGPADAAGLASEPSGGLKPHPPHCRTRRLAGISRPDRRFSRVRRRRRRRAQARRARVGLPFELGGVTTCPGRALPRTCPARCPCRPRRSAGSRGARTPEGGAGPAGAPGEGHRPRQR